MQEGVKKGGVMADGEQVVALSGARVSRDVVAALQRRRLTLSLLLHVNRAECAIRVLACVT